MDDRTRTSLLVAGLVGVAVVAVLASFVHGIAGGEGKAPLHVADVQGTWTFEDGTGARLLIRADGSVEVSKDAQIRECGVLMWPEGQVAKARWAFGDVDDPRMVSVELPGAEPGRTCRFDFTVADEGNRTAGPGHAYVRSEAPH
ncbi:hypothetical protein ACODT5_41675 [Streptomyces sp. 5.8]|uniref:hypothetical protein n=1 Tax=Streptomyces sp. 5.8 TaxID=3406571 RepID=UPI003BB6F665